jgi:hypothetical protein
MPKTCPQCQSETADDANHCPNCGAALSPAAAAASAAAPAPAGAGAGAPSQAAPAAGMPAQPAAGSSVPAFRFDLSRLTLADRIAGVATVVLFISLFLPWYTGSYKVDGIGGSSSVDGLWHGWMYLSLILCIAIVVYLVVKAAWDEVPISGFRVPHLTLMMVATIVNFVLVLIAFIDKPSAGVSVGFVSVSIGWGFGAILGLLAAIVAGAPYVVPQLRAKTMG